MNLTGKDGPNYYVWCYLVPFSRTHNNRAPVRLEWYNDDFTCIVTLHKNALSLGKLGMSPSYGCWGMKKTILIHYQNTNAIVFILPSSINVMEFHYPT